MSAVSSNSNEIKAWPSEIRLSKDKKSLKISFDTGVAYQISAELLRVMSPSAELRGHSEAERKTVGGKRNVMISAIEAIGNYAIRLSFDDHHSTGIYTWTLLADLGAQQITHLENYNAELAAKGLSRDFPGQR